MLYIVATFFQFTPPIIKTETVEDSGAMATAAIPIREGDEEPHPPPLGTPGRESPIDNKDFLDSGGSVRVEDVSIQE